MKVQEFVSLWPRKDDLLKMEVPAFIATPDCEVSYAEPNQNKGTDLSGNAQEMMKFICTLWELRHDLDERSRERNRKRVKIELDVSSSTSNDSFSYEDLNHLFSEIESLYKRYNALFEWVDGPLVQAMRNGEYILLDELSLADDAVIERLNSVLEPSRTLVLAERGSVDESESPAVVARNGFQLFATMNPGGDFGKRELSPALRNRFTEIWVPPVDDYSDIDLVLRSSLASIPAESQDVIRQRMMEYVEWFNIFVCSDPLTCELLLSLRDIITWARFIIGALKSAPDAGLWELYWNGAYLMHLDGLGLGTGIGNETVSELKQRAVGFLAQQVGDSSALSVRKLIAFDSVDGKFGRAPFWIPTGSHPQSTLAFNFQAPTTSANVERVLRAMQLSKPILLEGSPGVGKTALVHALAAASGHKLVRINLSEQSDISDLLGSDLPVPDHDDGDTPKASFQWCDGVFLSAIKEGHWVLLDELNLAPQTVLEGLNSCLDHRASMYIPELGRTFNCPLTFRVFAAQNPLAQGGGRKGLPRSFLNRFTKVYIDPLSDEDLKCVVSSRYPRLPCSVADKMIRFNRRIHEDSTDNSIIGLSGGPWEFNLRDIFRWCELAFDRSVPKVDDNEGSCFARDLYMQRFRTREDRAFVISRYIEYFGINIAEIPSPDILITRSTVRVGDVVLSRQEKRGNSLYESVMAEPALYLSQSETLEAIARCVQKRWPCLLVGKSGSQEACLFHGLSELLGAKLCEIALSPSSDISELIGCFEQVDSHERARGAIRSLKVIATEFLLCGPSADAAHVADLLFQLSSVHERNVKDSVAVASSLASFICELPVLVLSNARRHEVSTIMRILAESLAADKTTPTGIFVWKDGPLIEAMTNGYWLHLKNANLCHAAVLDRINPVMEPDGSLVLAECAAESRDRPGTQRRRIECHPNFRIFLSMNPEHGEISRAMRNRCVEISLPESMNDTRNLVDAFDSSWIRGIRISSLVVTGVPEHNYYDRFSNGGTSQILCSRLCLRGISQGCNTFTKRPQTQSETFGTADGIFFCPRMREDWLTSPSLSRAIWDGRLLRHVACTTASVPAAQCPIPDDFLQHLGLTAIRNTSSRALRDHYMLLFFRRSVLSGASGRERFLDLLRSDAARTLRFFAERLGDATSSMNGELTRFRGRRLLQVLEEERWTQYHREASNTARLHMSSSSSVLSVSYFLSVGSLDRTMVSCPITPMMFPFLAAFDRWSSAVADIGTGDSLESDSRFIASIFSRRDELWLLLRKTRFSMDAMPTGGLLQFDATEFIVQWTWFRRELDIVIMSLPSLFLGEAVESWQTLKDLLSAVDKIIFDGMLPQGRSLRNVVLPLVPQTNEGWILVSEAAKLGEHFSPRQFGSNVIEMEGLLANMDPVLVVPLKWKEEVLAVLCMAYLSSAGDQFASRSDFVPKLYTGVCDKLQRELDSYTKKLARDMDTIRIDVDISDTDENPRELGELQHTQTNFASSSVSYRRTMDSLLDRFACIQLMPLAEYWCEIAEVKLISKTCAMMLNTFSDAGSQDVASQSDEEVFPIEELINVGLGDALWTAKDLQPYQLLRWCNEASDVAVASLSSRILPSMCCNAHRHRWLGSFKHFRSISLCLGLPILNTGNALNATLTSPTRDRAPTLMPHVPTGIVFSLIGSNFDTGSPNGRNGGIPFITTENFRSRRRQSKKLVRLLARLGTASDQSILYELTYLLVEALQALRGNFLDTNSFQQLVDILSEPKRLGSLTDDEVRQLAKFSDHSTCHDLWDQLIFPLVHRLRELCKDSSANLGASSEYANARIFLGLLRYQIFVPDSPLDPGRKPLGKVKLIDRKLSRLSDELAAVQLENGVICGVLDPQTGEARTLRSDIANLVDSRKHQEKKVIRRPPCSPHFGELFREVRDFGNSFLDLSIIRPFLNLLMPGNIAEPSKELLLQKVEQWQTTAQAFCDRLLAKFGVYEDVILRLVDAVGNIKIGLTVITDLCKNHASRGIQYSKACISWSKFPFDDSCDFIPILQSMSHDSAASKRAVGFAMLSRLFLTRRYGGLGRVLLHQWHIAVGEILGSESRGDDNRHRNLDCDEIEEVEFRRMFPDHRAAFSLEDLKQESGGEDFSEELPSVRSHPLCDEQVELLCTLHRDLFASISHSSTSRTEARLRAFRLSFGATHALSNNVESITLAEREYAYSGHAMAIAICNVSETSTEYDFHHDPNPGETSQAGIPLDNLVSRVSQLLALFPGNSILVAVARVAERVRKLDLLSVSVGRVMVGLEVVLKHSQDWEQHASVRFRIGQPLNEISGIVTKWRKLELQNWSALLRVRERMFEKQSRQRWDRVHRLLLSAVGDVGRMPFVGNSTNDLLNNSVPAWVWTGFLADGKKITGGWSETRVSEYVAEVLKALDTFIFTAPLGEFHSRLDIIGSFSRQQDVECSVLQLSDERVALARTLTSLWGYYSQFLPLMAEKVAELRRPFEKRLAEEAKLAKWDQQTYYALAESSERNYRKLMRILREYDKCLQSTVGSILEKELCHGIRQAGNSNEEEAATDVPSEAVFLPPATLSDLKPEVSASPQSRKEASLERHWQDATVLGVSPDIPAARIGKYTAKVVSLHQALRQHPKSWAARGAAVASTFCDAIFERIESLRSDVATRPMKERALVDLMKELKRQGFAGPQRKAPTEVSRMSEVFLLPALDSFTQNNTDIESSVLRSCDLYFQRCLAEMSRYKSEVDLLGSRHLTVRQMNALLCCAENGLLLLLQQRSMISVIISHRQSLYLMMSALSSSVMSLPPGQTALLDLVQRFTTECDLLLESFGQLSLFLKSMVPMLEEDEIILEIRSVIEKLDGLDSSMSGSESLKSPLLVTRKHLETIENISVSVEYAGGLLDSLRRSLKGVVPVDGIDNCLRSVERTLELATTCLNFVEAGAKTSATSQVGGFVERLSQAVEAVLLSVQAQWKSCTEIDAETELDASSILGCHRHLAREWASVHLARLQRHFSKLIDGLKTVHDSSKIPCAEQNTCARLCSDVSVLVSNSLGLIDGLIGDTVSFHRELGKLQYVLLRVFRVLTSKGFCSDSSKESGDAAEVDASGLNFEERDGTGMGEGGGSQDVTDQIENEEQLLGTEDDAKDGETSQEPPTKLGEKEAEQGMEMEADFDGTMHDVPDVQVEDETHSNDDGDDDEELDREMGEGADPNEEVVDEKMWNESDEEENKDDEPEKLEDQSSVRGDGAVEEMITRDDDHVAQKETTDEQAGPNEVSEQEEGHEDPDVNQEDPINEDTEDLYEENHGTGVRQEEPPEEAAEEEKEQDDIQLEANLAFDDENSESLSDRDGDGGDVTEDVGAEDPSLETPDHPDDNLEETENEQCDAEAQGLDSAVDQAFEKQEEQDDENIDESDDDADQRVSRSDDRPQHGLGIHSKDGKDTIDSMNDDTHELDGEAQGEDTVVEEREGAVPPEVDETGANGESGTRNQQGRGFTQGSGAESQPVDTANIPNPLRNPGDATKYWHRKLNIIESDPEALEEGNNSGELEDPAKADASGAFEYTEDVEKDTAQVLGEVDEKDAMQLEEHPSQSIPEEAANQEPPSQTEEKSRITKRSTNGEGTRDWESKNLDDIDEQNEDLDVADEDNKDGESENDEEMEVEASDSSESLFHAKNHVETNISQLQLEGTVESDIKTKPGVIEVEESAAVVVDDESVRASRVKWSRIQSETHHLSRRLCEKLRLVMEPLVASKLRGDYRTGKRINMKRVIGYIASGYRRDKIWLRRTKPAKRNYRVLVAVDDSESMRISGAGEMALKAMATLAVGMSHLEVGQIGVASFGDEMHLLHEFDKPFTAESGPNIVRNFSFTQQRTRTALCVESTLMALEQPGDLMSMQLVFLISDGRIERDSRSSLRRLMREMTERNILLAMIIVEGHNKKDSILNMKEVTFDKGKPTVKRFVEDYPFPYYIVLDDMQSLPEVLGDALRQWFEMLARLQQ